MQPTDPSDAHLEDRIVEFRIVKSAVVVFLVALAATFYGWEPVVGVFAVGYVGYKYRYYTRRVGVFGSADLSTRHDRLEYALLGFGVATVLVLGATQTVFDQGWAVGGFLTLPEVDLTSIDAVLSDPVVLVPWVAVVAPVVVVTYVCMEFRKRLLVGVNTRAAAVRATIYDSLACVPVAVLWLAVLGLRPVYEVWRGPIVETVANQFDLDPAVTPGPTAPADIENLSVLLGDGFVPVVGGATAITVAVVGAYLAVQRRKYGNSTVPELFGYRGFLSPSRAFSEVNAAVPAVVVLLCALAVVGTAGTAPFPEVPVLAGVAVAVLVGADVRAITTAALRRLPGSTAAGVDGVVAGVATGTVVFAALALSVGLDAAPGTAAVAYLVVASPVAYAANRLAARQAAASASAFGGRVETDWNAFDRGTVDRLFLYSEARDNTLRAAAIDGLASAARANTYRKDEALGVFRWAIQSDDEAVARAGLRGFASVLSYDRSRRTYDWLVDTGLRETVVASLDRPGATRLAAAEAAARVLAVEIDVTESADSEQLGAEHVGQLYTVAIENPGRQSLVDATIEYYARLYYRTDRDETSGPARQQLLGSLVDLSASGSGHGSLLAVYAVTSERTAADERRFDVAVDALDNDRDETRYLAAYVVRSSLFRHADRVDPDRLTGLLADRSEAVRTMGAETLVTLLQVEPGHGPDLLDALVYHLEETERPPGRTEGAVLRALDALEPGDVLDHPTAASTVAGLVGRQYPAVSRPAADVLASLVESSPALARQESVGTAIENGLTHHDMAVRRSCLEAVTAVVDAGVDDGRRFVHGLGANLGTPGRNGVLAAVTLRAVSEDHPDALPDIFPDLAAGLGNRTGVDSRTVPFVVRGETVSGVCVDIVADAVALRPERGEPVIEPLVDLARTAEGGTVQTAFRALAELSAEFPSEARAAVDVASAGLERGGMQIRRDAAEVLANVAAYHPETVLPAVDALLVATEDNSPRVRAAALIALQNVCSAIPGALESDMHRLVGRLDDDSATVRKHAADLVSTVAEREPELIEPAAEAADRLRRLQRDPAVDVGPDQLQNASTAIQTGVPATEVDEESSGQDDEEIWTPESSDEMGVSGETNVFEPVGDEFDADFEADVDDAAAPPEEPDATGEAPAAAGGDDTSGAPGEEPGGVDDQETVIQKDEAGEVAGDSDDTSAGGLGDEETVIQKDETSEEDGSDEGGDTGGLGDEETVIQKDEASDEGGSDDTGDTGGLGNRDTVIQKGDTGEADGSDEGGDTGGPGDEDTVIRKDDESDDTDDTDGLGNSETVIRKDDDETDSA